MKCHYEVLNIERNASDDDIKKSYRKLALKWHPDKNPDQIDECTRQFHQIQQAYEVLIDPQERAWYDKHREAILRGGLGQGDKYEDNSLDVYQYFNAACYSGYGDDDKSFYTIYRTVFEEIATEDKEFMDGKDSDVEIPEFGNSQSSYEEVVGPFYAYWESYCTMKSYVWKEKYDTREAGHRQIRRAMEQENKKLRDKAKKERNEEVRALVAFVRKRDKRVQAYKLKLEERAAEISRLTEEKKRKQKEERLKQFEKFKEAGWSAMDGLEKDLAALDAHYASDEETEEEGDSAEGEEEDAERVDTEDTEEMLYDDLYCVACNRAFKTEKAFENHENSKKHRDKVAMLKMEMEEEEHFVDALDGSLTDEDCAEVLYDDLYCVVCDKIFSDEKALTSHVNSKKHKQSVRAFRGEPEEEENVEPERQEAESQSAAEESYTSETQAKSKTKSSKKQKKKRRKQQSEDEDEDLQEESAVEVVDTHSSEPITHSDRLTAENDEESADITKDGDLPSASVQESATCTKPSYHSQSTDSPAQVHSKNSANKKKAPDPTQPGSASQEPLYCNVCHGKFHTRNKLFQHIKEKGHALRLDDTGQETERSTSKKSKKKKGKR